MQSNPTGAHPLLRCTRLVRHGILSPRENFIKWKPDYTTLKALGIFGRYTSVVISNSWFPYFYLNLLLKIRRFEDFLSSVKKNGFLFFLWVVWGSWSVLGAEWAYAKKELIFLFQMVPSRILCDQKFLSYDFLNLFLIFRIFRIFPKDQYFSLILISCSM